MSIFLYLLAVIFVPVICFANGEQRLSEAKYPLFKDLDTYEMKVSSLSPDAQKYFNQGLLLYYGYNYPEAAKSFKAASLLNPDCALTHWGVCLAFCDCVDYPGDKWDQSAKAAYQRMLQATQKGTEKESNLMAALTTKFQKNQHADNVFMENMKKLHYKYPDDPDITAILANVCTKSLNLYQGLRDDNPKGIEEEIIAIMESAMKKYPHHPGLNHFYIHAMEEAGTPEKALDAAIRLDGEVPGSGHLQHMPAHIYFLYGRYNDATRANQSGIKADDAMFEKGGIKDPEFSGFYLHNYYFLFASLMMEGRSEEAIKASEKIVKRLKDSDLPSNPYFRDVFFAIPPLLMARTGKWERLRQLAPIEKQYTFANGMRTYAKGLSSLKRGNITQGEKNYQDLTDLIVTYEKQKKRGPYNPALARLLKIASLDLGGAIMESQGNRQKQIAMLKDALSIEDTLDFHMLPWYMFIRHALGAAFLAGNRFQEAEKIFREDLVIHPHNGWALFGLAKSLKGQQRDKEAAIVNEEFKQAWKYADVQLKPSRL